MVRNIIKWIVIAVVMVALAATVAILAVKLDRNVTTKTISASSFKVGGLDENGEYTDDKTTIVSKDFISVDGLEVTVKENAKIQYKLAFYDKYKKLVGSMTEYSEEDYTAKDLDKSIVYVKVVVEPLTDAEISWNEVRKYAGQLTVTINK